MFGFGNNKQKKYKKALEEFLQKMMSVREYFEIIQARGKGQSQMAENLGVKVSDTDYWAKEHFEEYKSRLSESNDPLSEIELRLKNFSFIKKEMENFINYAKELEVNLTQGFVDDYYANVATIKSLSMCNSFYTFKTSKPIQSRFNEPINRILDLPKDILVVEDDKLMLSVYKSVVNENTGDIIDSLDENEIKRNESLFVNKFFKVKSDPFTIVGYFKTQSQALSFYNSLALREFPNHLLEGSFFNYEKYSSAIKSETYRKDVRVSIQACSIGLTARKSSSFMVELTFNLILEDHLLNDNLNIKVNNIKNNDSQAKNNFTQYNYDDVRELIDQLKNHKPKIKIILTEHLRGDWQLHPDFEITEEFKSSGAFVYDSHGLTNDDHETDCGQYHNLNCEFDETKDVYGNSFEFIGVGYFSLDKFIQYLEDFVKEGGCNNGYDTDSEADFSYDGFKSVFDDWLWEARVEELNVADSVESHDDIEFLSLEMCYAGIRCIGWQGIYEVRSNEVEFEIVID